MLDAERVGEDADGHVVDVRTAASRLTDQRFLQWRRNPDEDAGTLVRSASSQTASKVSRLDKLPQLATHKEHPLDDRDPRKRGENVDRPLQQAPRGEEQADGDKDDALDA